MNCLSFFGLCGVLFLVGANSLAGDFYRTDLSKTQKGDIWIGYNAEGKRDGISQNWDMWPKNKGEKAAQIEEKDGSKVLQINPGFTVFSTDWKRDSQDATQSITYQRFVIMAPKTEANGVIATIKLQQVNNLSSAYLSLAQRKGKLLVIASNGDGSGKVEWSDIAEVEFDQWITINIIQNCKTRQYDIAVNNGEYKKGFNFRHATKWIGTMWPEDLLKPGCRFDLETSKTVTLFVKDIIFSASPIQDK